ncbi:unnamed protein product [Cochlearia groenlandica]
MNKKYLDRRSYSWSGQARPYICDFCERGFSNAQALGGHMNIHRKDRAKLRQANLKKEENDQEDSICTTSKNRFEQDLIELPFFVDRTGPTIKEDNNKDVQSVEVIDLELRLGLRSL